MPIATGRKLANYRFEVLGEESLSFPAGARQAVHIRTRSGNDTHRNVAARRCTAGGRAACP